MASYKTGSKLTSAEQQEVASKQWDRYTRARDNGHLEYVDMAKKCDAFYRGDQWDESDVAALDAEGRPALTINTVLPTVNTVLGEQSTRRADVRFKPRRGGDEEVAHTLTKLYMQIADNNKLDWVEQQVFSDGLILDGRGYFDVRMDFSDHVEGEVRITAKDPLDILIDPDAKDSDPETWNEVFETKWMTLDEIEELYGKKKAEELRFIAENGNGYGRDSIEYEENRFGDLDSTDDYLGAGIPGDDEYRNVRALRVIERQHKRMTRVMCFVDPETGDQRDVPEPWSEAKAKKFAKKYGLNVIRKVKRKVRWTVTCDRVVLHDDWSPYDCFTVVPFFAYFRRGRPFGMVRNLLSPQEQLNKIASQELHIVNTTANSGWMVESGSLVGMSADDLEEHGAETGLVLEYNRGSTPPVKIQPNQIPTGLDRISQKAALNIKSISGINDSMLGTDSAEVSGVAIQAKQNRGAIMIQVPLDNLRKTRQYLAEHILKLLQTFYTERRVIMVTNEEDPLKPREPMVLNEMTPEGRIINDLTIGEYDVVIASAPARDSFDEVQFAEALNLRQVGVAIPDDAIIEYSHLSKKEELAKRIRMLTGQEPPTPEQAEVMAMQQQMAIQKLQLEIAQLEADVRKTQSDAAVNIAKVQDMTDVQPQMRLTELQTQIDTKREELQLRRDLAAVTNETRMGQAETNAATRIAATAMQTAAKRPKQTDIPNFRES
ncbi:genomic island protein [Limnobacter sp.]|uniref:portal protein n=1 Tax=Limnobacter sp. TaxID=2003368 RepID=UPI0025BD3209|nr:genomic island protein [Limnobacter sp.]